MAEMRNQNRRVYGKTAQRQSMGGSLDRPRIMTPEQKAQQQADTEKSYQVWKAQREARLAQTRQARLMRLSRLT